MADTEFQHPVIRSLRDVALSFPEVAEGDSCVKRAFKVRNKGFLYLGEKATEFNVMVKLNEALAEASALSSAHPGRYLVGKAGWVTMHFALDDTPPAGLIERWIDESYRQQAPKSLRDNRGG